MNSTELADARNKYTGRLQKEVVEDCVGHKHLEALQVKILVDKFPKTLKLSSLKLEKFTCSLRFLRTPV